MCVSNLPVDDDGVNPRVVTRAEAKAAGLKFYFTGLLCVRGHVTWRYTAKGMCVACQKEHGRRFYADNKDLSDARAREWIKANEDRWREWRRQYDADNESLFRERRSAYYAENSARIAARATTWNRANKPLRCKTIRRHYLKHRSELIAKRSQWAKDNPDAARAIVHRRRARKLAAGGDHTAQDIQFLYLIQEGQCAACTIDFAITGYHVDHVMPIARGGSNDAGNLQLLCPSCNLSKSAKTMDEWTATRGW